MPNHDYIPSCGCNYCTIGRLTRELGDARQSIIDLQGANAAYEKARQADYARRVRLWAALSVAYKHLDMDALRVSHARDAQEIEWTLWNRSDPNYIARPSDQPSGGQS